MGVEHLQEFTDDSLFKNIVDVMEDIFGIEEFTFIITLIIASRSGLQESEIVKLIEQENVLKQGNIKYKDHINKFLKIYNFDKDFSK